MFGAQKLLKLSDPLALLQTDCGKAMPHEMQRSLQNAAHYDRYLDGLRGWMRFSFLYKLKESVVVFDFS